MTDNDTLFPVEPSQPTRLQLARARYEAAYYAWESSDTDQTSQLQRACTIAEKELRAAEREALEKQL